VKSSGGCSTVAVAHTSTSRTRSFRAGPRRCWRATTGPATRPVVRLLLDKGALRNEKDADGYTALIWASLYGYGHTEVMRLLLDKLGRAVGALLDEKKEGDTALIMGSRRGHTEVW
jgi:hypothetical protein